MPVDIWTRTWATFTTFKHFLKFFFLFLFSNTQWKICRGEGEGLMGSLRVEMCTFIYFRPNI